MALVDIEAGSKASSQLLNDNFHYLQDLVGELSIKIDGSEATVDSKIATSRNSLQSEISALETEINNSIAELEKDVTSTTTNTNNVKTDIYTKGFLPNYSAGVSISTGYKTTKNGWVRWYTDSSDGKDSYLKVNGTNVGISRQYKYHNHKTLMFLVSKGDTITFDAGTTTFYPCKGGV